MTLLSPCVACTKRTPSGRPCTYCGRVPESPIQRDDRYSNDESGAAEFERHRSPSLAAFYAEDFTAADLAARRARFVALRGGAA